VVCGAPTDSAHAFAGSCCSVFPAFFCIWSSLVCLFFELPLFWWDYVVTDNKKKIRMEPVQAPATVGPIFRSALSALDANAQYVAAISTRQSDQQ